MANLNRGTLIHFGVSSGVASGSYSFGLIQSANVDKKSDNVVVLDATGNAAAKEFYNFTSELTITTCPTFSSGSISTPNPGDMLTVTDSQVPDIAGTTWIVDTASPKQTNTGATMIDIKATKYPGITS